MADPGSRARPSTGRTRVVLTPSPDAARSVRTLREVLGRPAARGPRHRSRLTVAGAWLAVGLGGLGAAAAVHQVMAPARSDFLHSDIWLPVPDTPREASVLIESTRAESVAPVSTAPATSAAPAEAQPVAARAVTPASPGTGVLGVRPTATVGAPSGAAPAADAAGPAGASPAGSSTTTSTTTSTSTTTTAAPTTSTTVPPSSTTVVDDKGGGTNSGSGTGSGSGSGSGSGGRNKPED